ncbi:hypothetical protein B0H14DRAFT_2628098 [Mycena olivaceomarginata]|nr:hypothetical protein B0H14DRAFT_2628098 [Mycena olivaceomarginata]
MSIFAAGKNDVYVVLDSPRSLPRCPCEPREAKAGSTIEQTPNTGMFLAHLMARTLVTACWMVFVAFVSVGLVNALHTPLSGFSGRTNSEANRSEWSLDDVFLGQRVPPLVWVKPADRLGQLTQLFDINCTSERTLTDRSEISVETCRSDGSNFHDEQCHSVHPFCHATASEPGFSGLTTRRSVANSCEVQAGVSQGFPTHYAPARFENWTTFARGFLQSNSDAFWPEPERADTRIVALSGLLDYHNVGYSIPQSNVFIAFAAVGAETIQVKVSGARRLCSPHQIGLPLAQPLNLLRHSRIHDILRPRIGELNSSAEFITVYCADSDDQIRQTNASKVAIKLQIFGTAMPRCPQNLRLECAHANQIFARNILHLHLCTAFMQPAFALEGVFALDRPGVGAVDNTRDGFHKVPSERSTFVEFAGEIFAMSTEEMNGSKKGDLATSNGTAMGNAIGSIYCPTCRGLLPLYFLDLVGDQNLCWIPSASYVIDAMSITKPTSMVLPVGAPCCVQFLNAVVHHISAKGLILKTSNRQGSDAASERTIFDGCRLEATRSLTGALDSRSILRSAQELDEFLVIFASGQRESAESAWMKELGIPWHDTNASFTIMMMFTSPTIEPLRSLPEYSSGAEFRIASRSPSFSTGCLFTGKDHLRSAPVVHGTNTCVPTYGSGSMSHSNSDLDPRQRCGLQAEGVRYLETLNSSSLDQQLPTCSNIQGVDCSFTFLYYHSHQRSQRFAGMNMPTIWEEFPAISERSHGSETTMRVGKLPSILPQSKVDIAVPHDDIFGLKIRVSPKEGGSTHNNSNFMRAPRISSPHIPSALPKRHHTHPTEIWDRTHHRRLPKLTRDSELNNHLSLVVGGSEATARSSGSSLRSSITESKFGSVPRALQQSPTSFDLLNAESYYQGLLWLARGPLETKLGSATRQLRLPGTRCHPLVGLSTVKFMHQSGRRAELADFFTAQSAVCSTVGHFPTPSQLGDFSLRLYRDINTLYRFASGQAAQAPLNAVQHMHRVVDDQVSVVLRLLFASRTTRLFGHVPRPLGLPSLLDAQKVHHASYVRGAMTSGTHSRDERMQIGGPIVLPVWLWIPRCTLASSRPFSGPLTRLVFSMKRYPGDFILRSSPSEKSSLLLVQLANRAGQAAAERFDDQSAWILNTSFTNPPGNQCGFVLASLAVSKLKTVIL